MIDKALQTSGRHRLSGTARIIRRPLFSPVQCQAVRGQTTVEYLLTICVIAVAMALVLMTGGLFEALAELFGKFSSKIALPYP